MKWTDEIDIFIMLAYYRITKIEIGLASYWDQPYREFMAKNMAAENGLYNTTSTIYNGNYPKQITRQFKTA
jgi:hypothetical protein